jgi:hypothetical protein
LRRWLFEPTGKRPLILLGTPAITRSAGHVGLAHLTLAREAAAKQHPLPGIGDPTQLAD